MRKFNSGLSLMELMVAGSIIAVTLGAVTVAFLGVTNTVGMYTKVQRLRSDIPPIRKLLGKYFVRAHGISIEEEGALRAGMLIDGHGAVVLASDLRGCTTWDPATSTQIENITQMRILCCEPNLSIEIDLPEPAYASGTSVTLNSVCGARQGLSIEVFRDGNIELQMCYEEFEEFFMIEAGVHQARSTATQANSMYLMEFLAPFSKRAGGEILKTVRFQVFDAIGGGNAMALECL